MTMVYLPPSVPAKGHIYTNNQIEQILAIASDPKQRDLRDAARITINTGARGRELAATLWSAANPETDCEILATHLAHNLEEL